MVSFDDLNNFRVKMNVIKKFLNETKKKFLTLWIVFFRYVLSKQTNDLNFDDDSFR